MRMLVRLLCLGLSSMPSLAASTDRMESRAFGEVTYREAIHNQPRTKLIFGIPARSASLTVTSANMSFIDDGNSLLIGFRTEGCEGFTSLDGYDEISLLKTLQQTIAGSASELAKDCGLRSADITHWRTQTFTRSTEILAAVDYMKHRSITLFGPSLVRCERRSSKERTSLPPMILDGPPQKPSCSASMRRR